VPASERKVEQLHLQDGMPILRRALEAGPRERQQQGQGSPQIVQDPARRVWQGAATVVDPDHLVTVGRGRRGPRGHADAQPEASEGRGYPPDQPFGIERIIILIFQRLSIAASLHRASLPHVASSRRSFRRSV